MVMPVLTEWILIGHWGPGSPVVKLGDVPVVSAAVGWGVRDGDESTHPDAAASIMHVTAVLKLRIHNIGIPSR